MLYDDVQLVFELWKDTPSRTIFTSIFFFVVFITTITFNSSFRHSLRTVVFQTCTFMNGLHCGGWIRLWLLYVVTFNSHIHIPFDCPSSSWQFVETKSPTSSNILWRKFFRKQNHTRCWLSRDTYLAIWLIYFD